MDIKEFEKSMSDLKNRHGEEIRELIVRYCKLNNHIEIGQTITDRHGRSIIVDRISFSTGGIKDIPECVYHGAELTKKMQPKKNGDRATIYQSNMEPK